MAFTSGNRRQVVFPARAVAYKTGVSSGTINLPREFKYIGALIGVDPTGTNNVTAVMAAPAGPLAEGNPPRARVTVTAPADGTAATGDVLLIQM
jgi:hypothetical protein